MQIIKFITAKGRDKVFGAVMGYQPIRIIAIKTFGFENGIIERMKKEFPEVKYKLISEDNQPVMVPVRRLSKEKILN